MEFRVVKMGRRVGRHGRVWGPQCPAVGCRSEATHEVKRGPKWVYRGCEPHAVLYAELAEEATLPETLTVIGLHG